MQPVYQSQRQSADQAARTASQQPASSLLIRNPHTAPHSHSGLSRSLRPSQVPIDSSERSHPRSDHCQQEAEGGAQEAPVAPTDFTKIPVFPPDRPNRPHAPSPFPVPLLPGSTHVLPGSTHANLAIGRVDDPLEHEAEHVAEQVIRMPHPDREEGVAPLQAGQARPADVGGDEVPGLVHEVLRSPGQPLDPGTRAFFEPRLGHDFSSVRVHADASAAASARAVRALAYTAGRDLVFAEGRYAPHEAAGRRLLAHELTHTVQQGAIVGLGPTARRANGSAANGILIQRQPSETRSVAGPTQAPRSPLLEQIDDRLSPSVRSQLQKDETLRQSLLTLHARIGRYLWAFVPRYDPANCKTSTEEACGITWVDPINGIAFHKDDDSPLQQQLKADGYTSAFLARDRKDRWGLREPRGAAGLHWHGRQNREIGVHIDLNPPGATGPEAHFVLDKLLREKTHTPDTLRQGVERRGVKIPILFEQELHGRLTTRFTELQSTMGGQPGARAHLTAAKAALDAAATIIWTRAVITDTQLAEATKKLLEADKELKNAAVPPAPTAPR